MWLLGLQQRDGHCDADATKKLSREDVAASYVIDPIEDLHIGVHIEIEYGDELVLAGRPFGYALAVHETALWNARVLHLWLGDLHGAILQVEVDFHLAHLVGRMVDLGERLLEVRIEAEHLLIVGEPRRQLGRYPGWTHQCQLCAGRRTLGVH